MASSRVRLMVLVLAAFVVGVACGGSRDSSAIQSPTASLPAPTTDGSAQEEEHDVSDPNALFDADVICAGAYLAWEKGDRKAAERFASPEAIEALFSRKHASYRADQIVEATEDPRGCKIFTETHVAEGELLGDGHVGFSISTLAWKPV